MDSHDIDIDQLLANEPWLRRLAKALVAPADVDDLVQQTLSSAIVRSNASEQARPRAAGHVGNLSVHHLRAWLGGVARNLARQAYRSKLRRQQRERTAAQPEAVPSTAEMLERLDAHRQLTEVVRDLDEPYRSTLLLRFYEELPAAEIALRLGVPASTVRTRLERGLARLRDRLDARSLTGLLGVILSRPPVPEVAATAAISGTGTALLGGAVTMTVTHKFAFATLPLLALGLGYWLTQPPSPEAGPTDNSNQNVAVARAEARTKSPVLRRATIDAPATPEPTEATIQNTGHVLNPFGQPLPNVPILRFNAATGIDQTFSVDLRRTSRPPRRTLGCRRKVRRCR